ncbi:MAG: PspC domain-containing protein, partial [Anaerolineales bacterium]|nr:PspC domain-containing protein [Anaerolineales bacterium]
MKKRLYRSTTDQMLGGVCGGLGNYLGIDPTFVRIFFFVMIFGGGFGFWVYLLLWVLIPTEGDTEPRD